MDANRSKGEKKYYKNKERGWLISSEDSEQSRFGGLVLECADAALIQCEVVGLTWRDNAIGQPKEGCQMLITKVGAFPPVTKTYFRKSNHFVGSEVVWSFPRICKGDVVTAPRAEQCRGVVPLQQLASANSSR